MGDLKNDGIPELYFTANKGKNALYLKKGDLKVEDINDSGGVMGKREWHTGCLIFDANGDGFQDLYISAVVGINGFTGHNGGKGVPPHRAGWARAGVQGLAPLPIRALRRADPL